MRHSRDWGRDRDGVRGAAPLKQRIAAGEFNAELLWLVTGLVRTLTPEANPSTELEPKPQFMQDMEAECAEGGFKERFSEFIAKETVPCDRKTATPVKEFKAAVATALGISKAQVGILMTSQGYASDGIPNSRARVVAGFHPQGVNGLYPQGIVANNAASKNHGGHQWSQWCEVLQKWFYSSFDQITGIGFHALQRSY